MEKKGKKIMIITAKTEKTALMKMMLFGKGMILIIPLVTTGNEGMTPAVNLITTKTAGQVEIF